MNKSKAAMLASIAFAAAAHAQHSPPAINTPTTAPLRLELPRPPPPPAAGSNGTSGWVNTSKPPQITLADIPGMFRPKN